MDGRRAGFFPGFATRPGNPGSGLGSGSKILNSGFRAGLVFGYGIRVPGRKPGIFRNFFESTMFDKNYIFYKGLVEILS